MPNTENIVINTGPIIALVAALGELNVLSTLYRKVLVPFEVIAEIRAGGSKGSQLENLKMPLGSSNGQILLKFQPY